LDGFLTNLSKNSTHNTCQVILEDVKVPVENLIGEEGRGFRYITTNFNHERLVIAVQACSAARVAYEEAFKEANTRYTFGKKLIESQVIRSKFAEAARLIEALQDNIDRIAYLFSHGVPDHELGAQCGLLKSQASKTFAIVANSAVQIFGGSGIVREGRGRRVERLYRDVKAQAIPGGSEEILEDSAIRWAVAMSKL